MSHQLLIQKNRSKLLTVKKPNWRTVERILKNKINKRLKTEKWSSRLNRSLSSQWANLFEKTKTMPRNIWKIRKTCSYKLLILIIFAKQTRVQSKSVATHRANISTLNNQIQPQHLEMQALRGFSIQRAITRQQSGWKTRLKAPDSPMERTQKKRLTIIK